MTGTLSTLFNILTGGDWMEVSRPLTHFFPGSELVFIIFVYYMQFGFVNILVGIFCEKMAEAVSTDRSLRVRREIEASTEFVKDFALIFKEMAAGAEKVSWPEFVRYVDGAETGHFLQSHG